MKTIKLSDVFRIIAGHSDYHGDNILSALTCLAEGKEVGNVKPLEVKTGKWVADKKIGLTYALKCSECEWIDNTPIRNNGFRFNYCPVCGAKMIEG